VAVNETLERREFLGWKLGLERMHRLCTLLGMPQHRFASIHVVGTNGKTSVTRMTAAILEAHGERAGAYLSPHIHSWRERIVIGGEPISEEAFADALERAEQSAQVADRSAGEEGPVTQYELLTAAAFVAFDGITLVASRRPPSPDSITATLTIACAKATKAAAVSSSYWVTGPSSPALRSAT
jgi:folylpolyglutamate synthase/dihydropteroate synthase